jgi:hypothetical protein
MSREMTREIRIIKRAERDLLQGEMVEKIDASECNEVTQTSPVQMTRTIQEWVNAHRQKATDELFAAQSFKRLGLSTVRS